MKRRDCLQLGGLAVCAPLVPGQKRDGKVQGAAAETGDVLQRVRHALLSMQRASWEQGVAAQAFLESGDAEMVYLMAREAVLRQTEEGRLSVLYTDNGVTDPAASGEPVLYAAEKYKDDDLRQGAEKMLQYLLVRAPRTKDGIFSHTLNAREVWIDSMYMAPPFLSAAGKHRDAVDQIDGIHKLLWNPQKRLYSHRWSDETQSFINENCWGVGNGWAMTGMARVARSLPASMAQKKARLTDRIRILLDSCLTHVRPDFLFHNVVDDPATFVETNLSQMTAYTIFRGVTGGWLERHYLETALKLREAAHYQVDTQGFVQGVCGAPYFERPGRAAEGQAFFLLMEAAFRECKELNP